MSWMQKLYEVYEAAAAEGLVGKETEGQPTLLPVCHTVQNAQIEITIDDAGAFLGASAIEKERQPTLIPCTESSAGRTSGIAPMPLMDKLVYIAADYARFCPPEGKPRPYQKMFAAYCEALDQWLPAAPDSVRAWGAYVKKGRVVADLVDCGLLPTDEKGFVPDKWQGEGEKPAIYRVVINSPLDALVRFRVLHADGRQTLAWASSEISQSFIAFQSTLDAARDVCYVRGEVLPVSESSPKYVRYPGDGAKLISANDAAGFTYRGRFSTAREALVISRETTEKAHNALKWLIQKQAWRNGDQVILAYATGGKLLPALTADTAELCQWDDGADAQGAVFSTNETLARQVKHAAAGYANRLRPGDEAIVMGLDSATPGRMAIFYYREMRAEDFFSRLCAWHTSCAWQHNYLSVKDGVTDEGKPKYKRIVFTGAPAPRDIIKAAYGESVGDKLLKSGVERLLPCIADGAGVPPDIVRCCARRASNRAGASAWEQNKALTIACALIRKYLNDRHPKEEWSMALQPEINDRSYLFGRALAYAENIERFALHEAGEQRTTNAERLMAAFSRHPAKSWMTLMERLQPYRQRLGKKAARLNSEMEAIISRLNIEGYTNTPLNEKYLLGYACQMQELLRKRNDATDIKNTQEDAGHDE